MLKSNTSRIRGFSLLCKRGTVFLVSLSVIVSCFVAQQVRPLDDSARLASGFEGGVFLLDGESGEFFATSEQWLVRAAIPASTFKVFSSLAALESGVVASTEQVIRLPTYSSTREEINRDLDFPVRSRYRHSLTISIWCAKLALPKCSPISTTPITATDRWAGESISFGLRVICG